MIFYSHLFTTTNTIALNSITAFLIHFMIQSITRNYIIINQMSDCCDHDHGSTHQHHQEEVIEEQSQQQKIRLKQLRLERQRNQNLQTKKKYMPLLKFLKKNGLKFKTAAVQKNSIEYFRVDRFKELLQKKKQAIANDKDLSELLQKWQKIFIFYERMQNQPKLKWPQQLQSSKDTNSKFASFPFDSSQSSKAKSILILLAVVFMVLFPLWPYELKYYLWLISYYLTMALVAVIILRVAIYVFFSIFGASFWIFPRFFDNVEIIESFKPFYSVTWWEGSNIYSIITRIAILSIFCYYGYHIYIDPTIIKENIQITKTIMDDINDWGISKIKGEKNFSQSALTDYSKLLNKTIEEGDEQIIDIQINNDQF